MRNPDRETVFRFKRFAVTNRKSAMKVGTDAVLLGAWAFGDIPSESEGLRILDVGCGTGVLSLMLAQRFPNAKITGVEIEPEAAQEARKNVEASPWRDRVEICQADFLQYACGAPKFDLIISNPPFFSNGELAPQLSRSMARHEGALNFGTLTSRTAALLNSGGRLAIVAPFESRSRLVAEGISAKLHVCRECIVSTVLRKPPRRIMVEFSESGATEPQVESLVIHSSTGGFSELYIELTRDFYLNF